MLLVIHPFKLRRGISATLIGGTLTIKYGRLRVELPLPTRPFIVGQDDEPIFTPLFHFIHGRRSIDVHYNKTFPEKCNVDGKKLSNMRSLMTICINRKWDFCAEADENSDAGIEIYRYEEKGVKVPCSIGRRSKNIPSTYELPSSIENI